MRAPGCASVTQAYFMLKKIKIQSIAGNPWVVLVVAVLIAGLLTLWIYRFLTGREAALKEQLAAQMSDGRRVAVMVPVRNAAAGTVISDSGFAAREIPADLVYDDMILASHFDQVANLHLVRQVRQGQPVRRADVEAMQSRDFSDLLKPGKRAFTIEVDMVNSTAKMLKPGNHVDLFLIGSTSPAGGGPDKQSARLLMSDMLVLATGQDVRPRDYGEAVSSSAADGTGMPPQDYDNVTLLVSPEQAARLALAQRVGSLRAVLRNAGDKSVTPPIAISERALFAGGGDEAAIEYIVGGRGAGMISKLPTAQDLSNAISAALAGTGTGGAGAGIGTGTAGGGYAGLAAAQQGAVANAAAALAGRPAQR